MYRLRWDAQEYVCYVVVFFVGTEWGLFWSTRERESTNKILTILASMVVSLREYPKLNSYSGIHRQAYKISSKAPSNRTSQSTTSPYSRN